jgi:hypothetical protein
MTNRNIIEPDTFDFLIDDSTYDESIIGLRINGFLGESVTVPMNAETADQVGRLLGAHARMIRDHRAVTPAKARLMRFPVTNVSSN